MENKVCFIVPYFGSVPPAFPLFINSLTDRPLDVLFFSDIDKPHGLPGNIHWNHMTFGELKSLIGSKLNMEITLNNPYKLCDFRPAFGVVFEEYIKPYQFWGSIDTDTIVGDFGKFITDERLNSIDIYSGVKEYLSGSLFLVRNNAYCNTIFNKSKDLEKIFTTEEYLGFDECGGKYYMPLKAGKNIFELNTDVQSFTELIFTEMKNGLNALFTDEILETEGEHYVTVEKNKILYNGREFLMLHFIYLKTKYYFKIYPLINQFPYYVAPLGVFEKRPHAIRRLFSKNMAARVSKKMHNMFDKLTK